MAGALNQLLKAGAIASGVLVGGASGALSSEFCNPTPAPIQEDWDWKKADNVARKIFGILDTNTNAEGVVDQEKLTTEVSDLLKYIDDLNISYIPMAVEHIAEERRDEAWETVDRNAQYAIQGNAEVTKEELAEHADRISEKGFPSVAYQEAVDAAVRSGSWAQLHLGLNAVKQAEESIVTASFVPVMTCRAEHNSALTP